MRCSYNVRDSEVGGSMRIVRRENVDFDSNVLEGLPKKCDLVLLINKTGKGLLWTD